MEFWGSVLMFIVWGILGVIAFVMLLFLIPITLILLSMIAEFICDLFRQ